MTINDPWIEIPTPGRDAALAGRRIDAGIRWDFFWSKGPAGEPRMVLDHANIVTTHLPVLKDIAVTDGPSSHGTHLLQLSLTNIDLQDLFLQLCLDVLHASATASTEDEARDWMLRQTWRWHRLLAEGSLGLLSEEEQKGLVGELLVLEQLMLEIGPGQAVDCWSGPLGAPKDFELGVVGIEAKTRRGTAKPHVSISSAEQLDLAGLSQLFLHVTDIAKSNGTDGFTLSELVNKVKSRVSDDFQVLAAMEDRLAAVGYESRTEYDIQRWIVLSSRVFKVTSEFPKIVKSELPLGLDAVKYRVDLTALGSFEVPIRDVLDMVATEVCG